MSNTKTIGVRFPPKDVEAIEQCIEEGYATNKTDFVLQAVREKVSACKKVSA